MHLLVGLRYPLMCAAEFGLFHKRRNRIARPSRDKEDVNIRLSFFGFLLKAR